MAERAAALFCQREVRLAAILNRGGTLQQARLLKFAQHAAQVAGIHAQFLRYLFGERPAACGQLIEHARFAEGVWGIKQTLLQCADVARVEAIEAPECRDLIVDGKACDSRDSVHAFSIGKLVDKVKQFARSFQSSIKRT